MANTETSCNVNYPEPGDITYTCEDRKATVYYKAGSYCIKFYGAAPFDYGYRSREAAEKVAKFFVESV